MRPSPLFVFEHTADAPWARRVLRRMPPLRGRPIRIHNQPGLRDPHGAVHAGSFLRERRIALACRRDEFARVLVHEVFHFVWLRLGNGRRLSYEELLLSEVKAGARGELGWSAEWRKAALRQADASARSRRWREYCCESFCDSAAWLFSGRLRHEEFTLADRFRRQRRRWFAGITGGQLSI